MRSSNWVLTHFALFATLAAGQDPPSHLPPVPPGIFNASARILINAPIQKVWDTLLDFPSYPEWNPFVRSQVVVDDLGIPLNDQTPQEGRFILIKSVIPPLEGPVDASTPSDPERTQITKEIITHVNTPEQFQTAWKNDSPPEVLDAERWSAVSEVVLDSRTYTLYESREVFRGEMAPIVEESVGEGLQKAFEAQATALKARAESQICLESGV
ncbi:hypothetical protein AAF712_006671 [Marasmius tenuissimus]|uniref:Coenzyme Q-binding protein COQ10 START domain-containing protein n=1 Tax=Marasmius tenuissimus TaxID=585030 RepID=A0ABR2ZX45_9AGAR